MPDVPTFYLPLPHVTWLELAITEAPAGRAPQRAFNLAWLATCHFTDGDIATGTALGTQGMEAVRDLRSVRILNRLAPLQTQTRRHAQIRDASYLAHESQRMRMPA